jgi:hypothetical protein
MSESPLQDASRDRSMLMILARLKKAGRLKSFSASDTKELIERLDGADSKRLAKAILEGRRTGLSTRDHQELLRIDRLAAK